MTGFELLRRLDPSHGARVIFITAFDEPATRDALRAAGNPPCLRKPFAAEELLEAVKATMGRPAV